MSARTWGCVLLLLLPGCVETPATPGRPQTASALLLWQLSQKIGLLLSTTELSRLLP